MAIVVMKRKGGPIVPGYQCECIADTEADVDNLPKCSAGSTALVVSTGNLYMVNASGEWKLFGGGA